MKLNRRTVATFAVVTGLSALVAGMVSAGAYAASPQPVPGTQGAPAVVVTSPAQVPAAVAAVRKAQANSTAKIQIFVVTQMLEKKGVNPNSPSCFWTKPGDRWENGWRTASGGVVYAWETTPGKLCPSKNSPTGWVKVDGGKTGKHCFNFAVPPGHHPMPAVSGVLVLMNFGPSHYTLKASNTINVHDWCGSATATATATASVSGRSKAEAQANAKLLWTVKIYIQVWTKVSAQVNCGPQGTPPTTPTPQTPQTTVAFFKDVYDAAGSKLVTNQAFPVTLYAGTSVYHVQLPGNWSKLQLKDAGGNVIQFGPGLVFTACEDESVLSSWNIIGYRCYQATSDSSGGEIDFTFTNQAKPSAPTPPPATQHHPSLSVSQSKSDPRSITVTVGSDTPSSITVNWGDGTNSSVSGASAPHTYPQQTPSNAQGAGINYTVTVVAHYSDGQDATLPGQTIFVPAPPQNGNTNPPPTTQPTG